MDPCSLSVAPASLLEAIDHADAVISKAAGYTRHNKGDIDKIDRIGNRNLADAASQAGVRRFVLTSILTCDQTPQIPTSGTNCAPGRTPLAEAFRSGVSGVAGCGIVGCGRQLILLWAGSYVPAIAACSSA
jgi:NAD(P)H-binding